MDRKALHKISYGLYVVTSKKGESLNGQIANTVFQITSEPPTIAVSINKENLTHSFICDSNLFALSVLSKETSLKFIGHFGFRSGREINKFAGVDYKLGLTGVPIVLENSIGYVEAEVVSSLDVGTHSLFIGKVVDAQILKDEEPLTYSYYHEKKRGKSPKASPTYIGE